MTTTPTDTITVDFTNRASGGGWSPPGAVVAGIFGACLMGPGAAFTLQSSGRADPTRPHPVRSAGPAAVEAPVIASSAAQLVTAIRERWQLTMTDLAAILGVSRPTLYNWLKGGPVADPATLRHLQTLAAAADAWQSIDGPRQDLLLDYTGPGADEISIRQAMARPGVTTTEIREMVVRRRDQYREAAARSRELLGDLPPVPPSNISGSSRRLHEMWVENAKALHKFRNSQD